MGDTLTYAAHRALLPGQSLVREYAHRRSSRRFPPPGTTEPGGQREGEARRGLPAAAGGAFADWRLTVEGRVATPRTFSLAELKQLPSRTQITRHTCEEGWTAIGQWTGVPLAVVLDAAGILPTAQVRGVPLGTTTGSTASTCSTRCTRRRSWPTA